MISGAGAFFYAGMVVLDLKRGKMLVVDEAAESNHRIAKYHEIEAFSTGGMFGGYSPMLILRELTPDHMTAWEWGGWDDAER